MITYAIIYSSPNGIGHFTYFSLFVSFHLWVWSIQLFLPLNLIGQFLFFFFLARLDKATPSPTKFSLICSIPRKKPQNLICPNYRLWTCSFHSASLPTSSHSLWKSVNTEDKDCLFWPLFMEPNTLLFTQYPPYN